MRSFFRRVAAVVRPDFRRRYSKRGVKLHRTARLFCEENLFLGKNVYFGPGCRINAEGGVRIGDGTVFAPEVVVLSSSHSYEIGELLPFDVFDHRRHVEIGRGVWVGYRAMIGPGVSIGDAAVVAMGSVVVKNVAPGEVVGGNPAKKIGERDHERAKRLLDSESYFIERYWSGLRPRMNVTNFPDERVGIEAHSGHPETS